MPPGEWNVFEIHAVAQEYSIFLNDHHVSRFHNTDPLRGRPPGYIGLQAHTGEVCFRNIGIKPVHVVTEGEFSKVTYPG